MTSPKARNTGCTKVVDVVRKLQVGSTLPAGPGAACTASATILWAMAMVNGPDEARFQGRKIPAAWWAAGMLYCRDVRSVGADVYGAQAHAAAGFDHALLQAAVEAGVDIEAADADADGGTPAIAVTVAPVMAVVKSAGRSGRCSGNGERGGGDQSEGHLAKHFKYSPI